MFHNSCYETPSKSVTIKDFMNNEVFMDCLAKQGIEVIDRKDNNGYTYEYNRCLFA